MPESITKIQNLFSNIGVNNNLSETDESHRLCGAIISILTNATKSSLWITRDKTLTTKYMNFLREGTGALQEEQVKTSESAIAQTYQAARETAGNLRQDGAGIK